MVQHIVTLEKRLRELENEMTMGEIKRTQDKSRIETELNDLKAKIRQVASEHTVFEGRFTITRQPNAVHVGEASSQ